MMIKGVSEFINRSGCQHTAYPYGADSQGTVPRYDVLESRANSERFSGFQSGDHLVEVTRAEPCKQLCDNCAFRPNSPERQDPYQWMRIWESTIEDGLQFSCHKGEIAHLNGNSITYEYPEPGQRKPCAGWIANRKAFLAKQNTHRPGESLT